MNSSIFKIPQCATRSAFDKNFKANASSTKPNVTFSVFSQPPELGSFSRNFGNIANKAKGSPSAKPKPPIPTVNCQAPESAVREPANKDPKIGPVQENETIARVRAMKNIPANPPTDSLLVEDAAHEDGKVKSKNPKNEKANIKNIKKKNIFSVILVEISFKISGLTESKR